MLCPALGFCAEYEQVFHDALPWQASSMRDCGAHRRAAGLTEEGLLAEEVLVVLQELGGVTVLLDGVLGGGAYQHTDVVHLLQAHTSFSVYSKWSTKKMRPA